jgi:hypothetical protein
MLCKYANFNFKISHLEIIRVHINGETKMNSALLQMFLYAHGYNQRRNNLLIIGIAKNVSETTSILV